MRKTRREAVDNTAQNYVLFCTNTQLRSVLVLLVQGFTRFIAQVLCSVLHTANTFSYLLREFVHTINRPYNYNYIYKELRKEGW